MTHQVLHHFQQVGERLHAIHHVLGGDVSTADRFQSLADQNRCVVKARLQSQFRIVKQVGIDTDLGTCGASTEEVNYSTAAEV
jgi:hypothetical protein